MLYTHFFFSCKFKLYRDWGHIHVQLGHDVHMFFSRDNYSMFRLYRDGDHIQRGGVTCTCQRGVVNCQPGVVG